MIPLDLLGQIVLMVKASFIGMIDEFNNDCPYDFKNIQFRKSGVWYYTFANDLVGNSYGNKISVYISSNKATLNAITFG